MGGSPYCASAWEVGLRSTVVSSSMKPPYSLENPTLSKLGGAGIPVKHLLSPKHLHPLAIHFRHVECAAGIEGHEVGELQGVRGAPTGGDAAVFETEVKDLVDISFASEQLIANDDE